MKSKWFGLTSVLLVLMLLLVACGATNEAPPDGGAVQETPGDGGLIEETPAEGVATEEMPAEGVATEAAPDAGAAAGECPVAVEEGATLTFSGWGDETEQQIYRDSITRFQEVCPGVTVNYEPIPADFQTKLKAAMAGGTAPDVFYVDDQLMTAFGQTGQLLPLDDYMAEAGVSADQFIPQLMPIFTYEDQVYGLPKDWGTLGLIYLPEAFDAAGIDYPTEDWTWDDLRTAAQTIAENTEYAGYCQGADWARFAPMVFSNGGAFASDDLSEATLDTPEVKEMAQLTADMYEEGSLVLPADIAASWCGEAIGKQLVGMTTEGGWMVNFMRQDYPDVTWEAVQIPAGPVTRADVIFTNAIGVNAATEFPAAAAALAIYVTSAENQAEIVSTGFAYSTHPEQADLIQNEQDQAIAAGGLLEDSRVAYWGPNTGRINDSVSQALSRVYLGDQTVDEAFAQADEEVQEALESAQ
ncbi:MAG TPA: extracellular solute-binding protein [Anaerolineae bacterium]|nr:extracellular solute-binding protein [Anaerolineae bacterium]